MKSRTSFFNGPVFRKNLARFAPLWGGYTLCLLLGMLLLTGNDLSYWFADHLADMCSGMGIVNFGYALLVAQVLFGDLYSTRMCNALHALPLRRECWFHTHVISGFVFSLLPTAIMAVVAAVILNVWSIVENAWQIPLYFLLASNLQYLWFFGVGVLCTMCAGNRAGMAVFYVLANFLSYLVYFLVEILITPMYYGAITPMDAFYLFCPVLQIGRLELIQCELHRVAAGVSMAGAELENRYGTFHLEGGWTYLAGIAAAGVVMLMLAKFMYRRRRLECAGDFLSTRKLDPVFMVLFSVTTGAVFQFVQMVFLGNHGQLPVFLPIGTVAGWFAGRMLLEGQTRIFGKWKNWLGLIVLMGSLAAVLYGASLDPFGVEDWVPNTADVKSVQMVCGYRGVVESDEAEVIADVIRIHQDILQEKLTDEEANAEYLRAHEAALEMPEVMSGQIAAMDMAEKIGYRKYTTVDVTYTLNNGWTVSREYWLWIDSEAARLAEPYFNQIGAIFDHYSEIRNEQELRAVVSEPRYLYVDGLQIPQSMLNRQMAADLVDALIADSEAGNLAQTDGFHDGFVVDSHGRLQQYYRLDLLLEEKDLYFTIYADSENCLAWMEQYGLRQLVDSGYGAAG